jgi:hypothetical protein
MSYTTLGTVLDWLQEPTGLTVRDNRAELVRKANDIRQHFYMLYEKVQMFMDIEECFCVKKFTYHCDPCGRHYLGITLPSYMQQIEAMEVSGRPVTLFNKWREFNAGFAARAGCKVQAEDMGDGFCTELDIGDCPLPVKIKVHDQKDCNKSVRFIYYDAGNLECTEEFRLSVGYTATQTGAVRFKNPAGIVFSHPLEGGAIIALCDERSTIISEVYPGETIPSLRRHRLVNVCENDVVRLRASRRYTPLYFDHDIVETDNKQAFVEMALSFKFTRSQSTDPQVLQKGAWHEARAKAYLLGEKARDEGGGVVRRINLLGTKISRSGLPSRRPCGWGGARFR